MRRWDTRPGRRWRRALALGLAAAMWTVGCSSDSESGAPSGDAGGVDAAVSAGGDGQLSTADAMAGADSLSDATVIVDAGAEVDGTQADAGSDTGAPRNDAVADGGNDAGDGDASDAQGPPRFALSMLHFNVQYVAGGTEGLAAALGLQPGPDYYEMDDETLQDWIVVQSFEPVLTLLEAHPSWTLTVEMQGLMVEVIAQRHPQVLDRMRALVQGGQLELVVFHYSDELWTASQREVVDHSLDRSQAVLDAAGLARSGVVFTQEGQFSEGLAPVMHDHGYQIAVLPKNLWKYLHGDGPVAPLYDMDGISVVIGGRGASDAKTGIETTWIFFDDGEKLMTAGLDPYLSSLMVFDQASYDAFEAKLENLEAQGWRIAGLADYVAAVTQAGVDVQPLAPVLDGTWQPKDTLNLYRWMGDAKAFAESEADNAILTLAVRARHAVLAAQAVASTQDAQALDEAWRNLLLGSVSDATGWNPWPGEVDYGLNHLQAALDAAQAVATAALQPGQGIDLATGEIVDAPEVALGPEANAPFPVTVEAPGWTVATTWHQLDPATNALELRFDFQPANGAGRHASVVFPFDRDDVLTIPALETTPRSAPLADFAWDRIGLPVAAGLIGLTDQWILVEDTHTVHLAAIVDRTEGTVTFDDASFGGGSEAAPHTWRFALWPADALDDAVAYAVRTNLTPVWTPPAGE